MATMFTPFNDFDRLAASLFARQGLREMPMDLYRDGDQYILRADLPGIDPESVDVDVDGQLLTIRAERTPRSTEGVQWLTRERPSGAYLRQITLGKDIDTEAISAHYENGVLSIMLPVLEKAKPRKISVATATDRAEVTA